MTENLKAMSLCQVGLWFEEPGPSSVLHAFIGGGPCDCRRWGSIAEYQRAHPPAPRTDPGAAGPALWETA